MGIFFTLTAPSTHDNMDAAFVADIPALGPFVAATPSFDGFHPDYTGSKIDVLIYLLFIGIGITVGSATALYVAFVRHMRRIKETVTPSTYEGFIMMFKSMVAQIVLFIIFLIIPNALTNLLLIFQTLWSSYTTPLVLCYLPVLINCEVMVLIYFIKPYHYIKHLKEFVSAWNVTYSDDEQWNLRQTADGTIYADMKYFDTASNLWLHAFIIFSDSYDAPVLWFNAYEPGAGLQKRVPIEVAVRTPSEVSKCSEGEHPILGIGFYYVDPCRINAATKDMGETANPILRWFSVAVQSTRLRSPIALFLKSFDVDCTRLSKISSTCIRIIVRMLNQAHIMPKDLPQLK